MHTIPSYDICCLCRTCQKRARQAHSVEAYNWCEASNHTGIESIHISSMHKNRGEQWSTHRDYAGQSRGQLTRVEGWPLTKK